MQEDHLHSEATLAITDPGAPAGLTAVQLFKRSLDTFLAKDIKGWAELCGLKYVGMVQLKFR
jgi:uncharacterized protein